MIAKSTAIKDRGGKSGGRVAKAVDLTSGGLRRVREPGLSGPQGSRWRRRSDPPKARTVEWQVERRSRAAMRQKTELEITLRAGARGEARSACAEGTEARAATTEVEGRAAGWPSME